MAGAMAPAIMIRLARLAFVVRCVTVPDATIVKILLAAKSARRSWVKAVQGECVFLLLIDICR